MAKKKKYEKMLDFFKSVGIQDDKLAREIRIAKFRGRPPKNKH